MLRGEEPPALDPPQHVNADAEGLPAERKRSNLDFGTPRKKRRLRGEDDTDRDIRYAKEDAETGERAKEVLLTKGNGSDAPLIDHAGHIQLLPAPDEKAIRKAEKNTEAEAEKAKKRKREEDQYHMRFSNAAGFNNGMARPWYAASDSKASSDKSDKALTLPHVQDKNAWGNEDPLRKERERSRISGNDPFAAMQQAQRQLKESKRDKEKWEKERLAKADELNRAEERKRRHEKRHRRRRDNEDSLEDFSLDASTKEDKTDRRRHRHYGRHRSRSRSRSRDRHRRSKD